MTPPAGDQAGDRAGELRRTRASYDDVAATYAERFEHSLAGEPLLRAMLASFAEQVLAGGNAEVADIGCGPGRVAIQVMRLGLRVTGVDLSSAMTGLAHRAGVVCCAGAMDALPLASGRFGGLLSWWSIFHTARAELPTVLAEFTRVLAPGGLLQLGTHVGVGSRRSRSSYGHAVDYEVHYHQPAELADALRRSGFAVESVVTWPAVGARKPQVLLTARRSG